MNDVSSLASHIGRVATVRVSLLAALLGGAALLAGCGQKGPLSLPKPPASAASAAAPK